MTKIQMINVEGQPVEELELKDEIFDIEVNEHAVYLVVKNILANRRQGTQSAKTRAEVRGGGRKPWRQKGSGRARHGSIRSPIWKGGGITFAPKPRDYSYTTPKKVRRLAMKSALTSKVQAGELVVVDQITMDEPKTKAMAGYLKAMGVDSKALLVVEDNKNAVLSARNIPGVETSRADSLNVYDILKYDKLVLTKAALDRVQEVYK